MIQNISIERLRPHPDNPRKDIGDLSELVESIKARGVLQNLTVVEHDGDYRIVIGNRRCEAAKLAGSEYGSFTLYREIGADEGVDEAERERELLRVKYNALQEISDRAYNLRREFVREISNSRSDIQTVAEHLTLFMGTSYISIDPMEVNELLGLPESDELDELIGQLLLKAKEQPQRYLLVAVYSAMDSLRHNYFNWKGEYHPCDALDRVYDFLEALGYEMSDEEQALRDGTHELFQQGVS